MTGQISDTISIRYVFVINSDERVVFEVHLDAVTLERRFDTSETVHAGWTRLDCHQCSHCPLTIETAPWCPVATNMEHVMRHFGSIASHDQLSVIIESEERTVSSETSAQRALSSLMGLLMATSGCPHTVFFRAMARFHQPMSNADETLCKAASMYLLSQYFNAQDDGKFDTKLEGLTEIYRNMSIINSAVAKRLREAFENDSTVNAVILLDVYAKAMPYAVEESLEEVKYLFQPYLDAVKNQVQSAEF